MGVKLKYITRFMDDFAPLHLAEEWDNCGLLLGDSEQEIERVMICLDVNSTTAGEAIETKADLVITHHPLLFKPINRITAESPKGEILLRLIKNNISVYSSHTNLDIANEGINDYLAGLFELSDVKSLKATSSEKLYKIVVFVPEESAEKVREALCSAGAGHIGNYSDCTFMVQGTGTFKPLEGSNPYIGSRGNIERVGELRIETIVSETNLRKTIEAMIEAHPYEEVAYDVYPLKTPVKEYGLGRVGKLPQASTVAEMLELTKKKLDVEHIRLIGESDRSIRNVAVFSGSFDGDFSAIIKSKADILITGDIKYHTAMEAVENGITVIDAGHFATERIYLSYLKSVLSKEFKGISIHCSKKEKDPFIYS